jgi:hypothetical protein
MSTLLAPRALATLALQSSAQQPSHFSLKGILAHVHVPHDATSIVVLVLCAAVVAWVLWAGHRSPRDESPEQ